MRVVRERSPWLRLVAVLGGFFLGPFSAVRLAVLLHPGSELVETVGAFGFALIYVGGSVLWMGFGVVTTLVGTLWSLVRGRLPRGAHAGSSDRLVPRGYRAYVVLGIAVGIVVGLLAGIATDAGVPAATLAWGLLGTGYGLLLWGAAHHGYLPFPEPQ